MKFIRWYFFFLILLINLMNLNLCVNSERNIKKIETNNNYLKINKKCRGFSENLLKQDEIEVSNYVIFFFILSYFYTNYL